MTISWPFTRGRNRGWGDAADDPLPAHLHVSAATEIEAEERVGRRRGAILAEFVASQEAPVRMPSHLLPRRLAFATLGAVLVLTVAAGGFAASGPGLPVYPLRLAAEELFLPSDGAARLEAQLGRLERRLDEAARATNAGASAAALEAYERIATDLISGTAPSGSGDQRIEARVAEQVRSLRNMAGAGSGRGAEALRSANGLLLWLGGDDSDLRMPGAPNPSATPSRAPQRSPSPTPDASPSPDSGAKDSGGSGGPSVGASDEPAPAPVTTSAPTGSGEPSGPAGPTAPPRRGGGGPS